MNLIVTALLAFTSVTRGQVAGPPPIVANWIGHFASADLGQMEIALQVRSDKGGLAGAIKTAHGDWRVRSITEKDGAYTIAFETPEGAGTMTGRIKEPSFTGQFQNPMTKGSFELVRSKKPV